MRIKISLPTRHPGLQHTVIGSVFIIIIAAISMVSNTFFVLPFVQQDASFWCNLAAQRPPPRLGLEQKARMTLADGLVPSCVPCSGEAKPASSWPQTVYMFQRYPVFNCCHINEMR